MKRRSAGLRPALTLRISPVGECPKPAASRRSTPATGLFFVSFARRPRHHRRVIGASLNALGILAGALFGLTARQPLSARTQVFFKSALGAFTAFFGLRLIFENTHGTFTAGVKQIMIAALGVILGFWIGKILRLQKFSNRLGHHAATLLAAAQKNPPGKSADGFLAAVPVLFFLNGLTFALHFGLQPWLAAHSLVAPINLAAGLITCAITLVIFEIRRVELNSYLPGLVVAPLLAHWWPG